MIEHFIIQYNGYTSQLMSSVFAFEQKVMAAHILGLDKHIVAVWKIKEKHPTKPPYIDTSKSGLIHD